MTTVKERPINLYPWEVLAILDGRKTEIRRKCSPANLATSHLASDVNISFVTDGGSGLFGDEEGEFLFKCPFGMLGDRLWGREAWGIWFRRHHNESIYDGVTYKAEVPDNAGRRTLHKIGQHGDAKGYSDGWKPSECMPRWVSRILLEVTNVRVERLQDISEADAITEGIYLLPGGGYKFDRGEQEHDTAIEAYADLWESINGPGSWERNDWVWAITFKKVGQ